MKLSEHFTLDEFTSSQTATRRGIDNTPTTEVLTRLRVLAQGLERVRSVLSVPINISSGYRCATLNCAIGGAMNSAHVKGLAADFTASAFGTPLQIARKLVENAESIGFDQLIMEGTWVHIAFPASIQPRNQVLTAIFKDGRVTYSEGLA